MNKFAGFNFDSFEIVVFEINQDWDNDLLYSYDIVAYSADATDLDPGIYYIENDGEKIGTVGNRSYRERTVIADGKSYDEITDELALLTGKRCDVDEFSAFFVWDYYKSNSDEEQTTGMFAIRKDGRVQEISSISNDFTSVWAHKALPNDGPKWFHENQFQLKDYPVFSRIRQAYAQLLASGQHIESM